jgi:hypothetical protein
VIKLIIALAGKLAGLTYRPSRECVVSQIIVTCAGGFVEQTVNGYKLEKQGITANLQLQLGGI